MKISCSTHEDRKAGHQCDGCERFLCDECVRSGHALLLCVHCGERALPVGAGGASTVVQQTELGRIAAVSTYRLREAWLYPFRGTGLFLFLTALVSLLVVGFVRRFGMGCLGWVVWLGWLSLLAGIQFKIVRTTAKGDDELPDWPEYFSFGERLSEFLTWLGIGALQYAPLFVFVIAFGGRGILTADPSLIFWVAAAACLWVGSALSLMGFGAAGVHWNHQVVRVDRHVRGLLEVGGDALLFTNCTFAMAALVVVLQAVLGAALPIIGSLFAATLGLYWTFVQPHLAGVLFRRHKQTLHAIYEGESP